MQLGLEAACNAAAQDTTATGYLGAPGATILLQPGAACSAAVPYS